MIFLMMLMMEESKKKIITMKILQISSFSLLMKLREYCLWKSINYPWRILIIILVNKLALSLASLRLTLSR